MIAAVVVAALSGTPTAQTFEVASIKLNKERRGPSTSIEGMFFQGLTGVVPNGRLLMTAVPARVVIRVAYDVQEFQVVGGPSWVNDDRYEIDARMPAGTTYEQMRPMLQALLADRFQLTIRREMRTSRVYEMVPARGGLKVRPTPPGGCYDPRNPSPGAAAPVLGGPLIQCNGVRRRILSAPPDRVDRIEAVAVPMSRLVGFVITDVSGMVIDKTGMTAPFDFVLDFAPNVGMADYFGPPNLRDPAASTSAVPISTAMQEQLGIQLRSAEAPVETIVIERIERPSEN